MAFTAFLDTCVLFSATLNDTLLRLAEAHCFVPRWSPDVLAELERNLVGKACVDPALARRRIAFMNAAFPDAELTGYASRIASMTCDPKDRHVLAAAAHGRCDVLVTFNRKDFPAPSLADLDVEVVDPDGFLLDQLDLYPARVGRALVTQVQESGRPRLTLGTLLTTLARTGVPRSAAGARRHELDVC